MNVYRQKVIIRWADLDPNGHVRHSAYFDYGAQARISYLAEQGFGIDWMRKHAVGPVLFREEARYLRELHLGDEIILSVLLTALSEDHRKWSMRHEIFRGDELCAILDMDGAWLDLARRKIAAPPGDLVETFEALEHSEDFKLIPPSRKK